MCLMLAEVELVLNISTKGIRLGSPGHAPAPRARGFNQLALTYNTLLSSQGTDAHRTRAFRPGFRATFQIYPNPGRKSNRSFRAFCPRSCGTGLFVRSSRAGSQEYDEAATESKSSPLRWPAPPRLLLCHASGHDATPEPGIKGERRRQAARLACAKGQTILRR